MAAEKNHTEELDEATTLVLETKMEQIAAALGHLATYPDAEEAPE